MPLIFVKVFLGRLLDALKWFAERPAIAVTVASLVLAGFFYIKSDHLSTALKTANSTIAKMNKDRKEAIKTANAEKKRIEAERKKITHEADKARIALIADYDARLRAYARRHPAAPNLSGASASPQESDGPDPEAIVVTIGDARICTVNTARLINARQWANETYATR